MDLNVAKEVYTLVIKINVLLSTFVRVFEPFRRDLNEAKGA